MSCLVPFLLQFLDLLHDILAFLLGQFSQHAYDVLFLLQIGFLLTMSFGMCFFLCFKELVACAHKSFPQGIGILVWYGAYLLPLFLQVDQDIVGASPVGTASQCFGLLHQFLFLGQVAIELFLELAEEL